MVLSSCLTSALSPMGQASFGGRSVNACSSAPQFLSLVPRRLGSHTKDCTLVAIHTNMLALMQRLRARHRSHHCRNAVLTRDNGRVRSGAAAVYDKRNSP